MNMIQSSHLHLSCLVLVSLLSIQVPAFAYSYGNPSAKEQEHLEYINRARAYPDAEAQRTDISSINEGVSSNDTISSTAKQPLVFNSKLLTVAASHAQDMLDKDYFSHTTQGTNNKIGERATAILYDWFYIGENLAYRTTSDSSDIAWNLHSDLFNDEAVDGRGHRLNILSTNYKEIGIGLRSKQISNTSTKWMIAADFGKSYDNYQYAFILGVAYDDSNNNDFYTAGEGLSGVTVTITGAKSASTTTKTAGGYAIPDLPSGNYSIVYSHADYGSVTKSFTVTSNTNVKVDVTLDEFISSDNSGSADNSSDTSGNSDSSDNSSDTSDNSDSSDSSDNSSDTSDNSDSSNNSSDTSDNSDSSSETSDNSDSSDNSSDTSSSTKKKTSSTLPSQPQFSLLTISSGKAHIISQPAGIDCDNGEGQCSHVFKLGTVIELFFAEELPEYLSFDGWNGDNDCKDNKVTLTTTINCAARIYGRAGFDIPATDNNTADNDNELNSDATTDSETGSDDVTGTNTVSNNSTDNDSADNDTTTDTDDNQTVQGNAQQSINSTSSVANDTNNQTTDDSSANTQAQYYNFTLAPYTQLNIINSNSYGEILGAENDLITGFVLVGTGQRNIMLRAQSHTINMTPSAYLYRLQIHENKWVGRILGQTQGLKAITQTLSAGAYTVQTSSNLQGFGQLGITTQSLNDNLKLTSLSTRGFIQSQISHQFVLQGEGFQKVLITGLALQKGINPALALLSGSDNIQIVSNDDWIQSWQKADFDYLNLTLGQQESAILAYLHAGTYTVVLTSEQQGLGIINIELLP